MLEYQVKFEKQGKTYYSDLLTPLPIPLLDTCQWAIVPTKFWQDSSGGPHSMEFDLGHRTIRVYNHPFTLRDYAECV